ncbi:phosphoglucosamine mutase [Geitlerinema sp. PCC 9228]|uniref:phosphoglucosamine mutase n=1 Tax=Geitlerinema sp. PCC 9228 TaxID=111611 RepID=UPI0008F9B073|nr:phosphoglucosamine mutase [Geitlerinema sp. PCC 9228]
MVASSDRVVVETRRQRLCLPEHRLFGTDGIRGTVGTDASGSAGEWLTAELAWEVGFWAGQVWQRTPLDGKTVLVGQDSRHSSEMLAEAIADGLNAAGLDVWHVGLCPTPGVAYLTNVLPTVGGVVISASHNPPEDNGIKLFAADGTKISRQVQEDIEAGIRRQSQLIPLERKRGEYTYCAQLLETYQRSLRESIAHIPSLSGIKVVLDLAWGAAAKAAPAVFESLGAQVIPLHSQPNGDRINVGCGSTHLSVLQKAVVEHQADLGFAFDGDADRVLAADHRGHPVDGDRILYLWGQQLRQQGQLPENTIVATVMSNLGFERAWQASGGRLLRTPVGDRHVQNQMREGGYMLGGEQSGHILCRHFGVTGDGLLTALHIAALVQASGVALAELADNSFPCYPQILKNVRLPSRTRLQQWQQCDAIQSAIQQAEAELGDGGRILVRASGTEPLLRIMVEAATEEMTERWVHRLVNTVQTNLAD